MMRRCFFFSAVFAAAIVGWMPPAGGDTHNWTGGGADNQWTTPLNWGGAAPANGDALVSRDTNPDGTKIHSFLGRQPLAERPTKGRIGLQGIHRGAARVWSRNVRIKELK